MYLAFLGGALLLISGTNGVATWENIKNIIISLIGDYPLINFIFLVLISIAALGGFAVIYGGILIRKGRVTVGKIFILLGCGTGIIGLIIRLVPSYIQQGFSASLGWDIGTWGIIFSVVARTVAK